jgi:hypothetical protein
MLWIRQAHANQFSLVQLAAAEARSRFYPAA